LKLKLNQKAQDLNDPRENGRDLWQVEACIAFVIIVAGVAAEVFIVAAWVVLDLVENSQTPVRPLKLRMEDIDNQSCTPRPTYIFSPIFPSINSFII
jgi:hypothetical protein